MKKVEEKEYTIKDVETGYKKEFLVRRFRLPNGMIDTFFVDKGGDSVQVLPITQDNHVVLVRQFRPGTEEYEYELPGGGLGKDEDSKLGAMRELKEETGLVCDPDNIIHIADLNYGPYSTGVRFSYVALQCKDSGVGLDLDKNEFLKVEKLSMDKLRELLRSGKVRGSDAAYIALDKLGHI
jgi:ADP-ribose pyrophosphatase